MHGSVAVAVGRRRVRPAQEQQPDAVGVASEDSVVQGRQAALHRRAGGGQLERLGAPSFEIESRAVRESSG